VLQQQLSQMKIQNDELSQDVQTSEALQQQIHEKDGEIQTIKATVLQWETYGATVQSSQAQVKEHHDVEVATLTTQISTLTTQVQEAQSKNNEHTQAMQSLQEEAATAKSEAAMAKNESAKAVNATTSYEIKIGSLQKELTRLQAVSTEADGMKIAKLELERDKISLHHKKAETRVELLELEGQSIKAERNKLADDLVSIQDKLAQKEQESEGLEAKLEGQLREFDEYKKHLEDPDGEGNDEGTQNDEDDEQEVDETATRLKQLRRLLDRERTEKLKADTNLHKAESAWKDQERSLQSSVQESVRQLSEHRQQISELKLRLEMQKEREVDERDRSEARVRTLEVSLAKASDSESKAKSQVLVLEEQIAEFELALRADDRKATLTNQIRENRELESRLLDAQKELKDKTVSLKKAEIELHYYKNEIERVRSIARDQAKKANPSWSLGASGAQGDPRAAGTQNAMHTTPGRGNRNTPQRRLQTPSRVMTADGQPMAPHQPPPPRQPPPPGATRTPSAMRTPTATRTPPPPSYPRGGAYQSGTPLRTARARPGQPAPPSDYHSSPLSQPPPPSEDATSISI